jgi:hypothetical protein
MKIDALNATSHNGPVTSPRRRRKLRFLSKKPGRFKINFNMEDHMNSDNNVERIKTARRGRYTQKRKAFGFLGTLTPHNTSQYLTANNCRVSGDYPFNISYTMLTDEEVNRMIRDNGFTIDDLTITGGSMKGIFGAESPCDICAFQVNSLLEVINQQRVVIDELSRIVKQQIQNVQEN